jgi:hypothetical protein
MDCCEVRVVVINADLYSCRLIWRGRKRIEPHAATATATASKSSRFRSAIPLWWGTARATSATTHTRGAKARVGSSQPQIPIADFNHYAYKEITVGGKALETSLDQFSPLLSESGCIASIMPKSHRHLILLQSLAGSCSSDSH